MNRIVEIKNLTVGYDDKVVLRNINLTISKDDFIGIIGPNGGGKTTLLKALLGLIPIQSGTIQFFEGGKSVSDLRIGYVPQSNNIDKSFPISVYDVIFSGLAGERGLFNRFNKSQKEAVGDILHQLDLENLKKKAH